MALLNKTTLQKSVGLLNATAPEDHFLAYITEGERDMLVRAGGKETSTVSGINAYPPLGEPGTSPGTNVSGGARHGNEGPAGGASQEEIMVAMLIHNKNMQVIQFKIKEIIELIQ